MNWRIAVDSGGTFTDIVGLDEDTGRQVVVKVPSTPADPSLAFADGVEALLHKVRGEPDAVSMALHGTTVATNAILEAKYARIGLIVNRGFREMLEVARQCVPGDFGDITWWIKPPRVVPLELVREISGRLDFTGRELQPLDADEIRSRAEEFAELGITAVAVSLLHSYRNPDHEQRVRETILDVQPGFKVSVSSDVIREYREYERTLSTCLNAGLMPLLTAYLERIETRMGESGILAPLYVMKSSGGVAKPSEIQTRPIAAVLSGPAAGAIGASSMASLDGYRDVISLDMGGTSADVALLENGAPRLLSEGKVDVYDLKAPMIDMTTVGAGGGSIAWLGGAKSLRVGPRSAGADPGPVCYGRGGEEPTITDANLVLGRISPYLLGGDITLDREAAVTAIRERIAEPLGLTLEKAAAGIVEIAVNEMAAAVRVVSVRRGRDPRHYALFAFGGAGALHACGVADALGMRAVIVPKSPGATSAAGLLFCDVRVDHIVTDVQREDALEAERLAEEYRLLRDRAAGDLANQGFEGDAVRMEAFVDMRYAGQGYELRLPLPEANGSLAEADIRSAVSAFHAAHEDQFGYSSEGSESVEVVNVGVTGFGLLRRPQLERDPGDPGATWDGALKLSRPMYGPAEGGLVETPVYQREAAPVDVPLAGPAIVEQYDSTVVVDAGWSARVSPHGQLILTRD